MRRHGRSGGDQEHAADVDRCSEIAPRGRESGAAMKIPEDICPDFPEWPERWQGEEKDVAYGQGLLVAMRPFVSDLIARGLKDRTIRIHMDNLWLLGGEIIREVSVHDAYDLAPAENLWCSIDEGGGPYCRHVHSEAEERSYEGFHNHWNEK